MRSTQKTPLVITNDIIQHVWRRRNLPKIKSYENESESTISRIIHGKPRPSMGEIQLVLTWISQLVKTDKRIWILVNRKALNLSSSGLGSRIGVSHGLVEHWESGRLVNVKEKYLRNMEKLFGIKVGQCHFLKMEEGSTLKASDKVEKPKVEKKSKPKIKLKMTPEEIPVEVPKEEPVEEPVSPQSAEIPKAPEGTKVSVGENIIVMIQHEWTVMVSWRSEIVF